ncbi:ABC transporter permease [Borrelia crocidurae]|uniref:ABC transporter permease n=1 Tax=Borrelia crocidurae TaxID=29520 RepID=UPI00058E6094|nr:ABC transporter permease [Borrelia crocidurae]
MINNSRFREVIITFISSPMFINFFSFFLGILIVGLVVLVLGYSPLKMYFIMIEVIFLSPKHLGYIISYATPLIFTGLSIGIALKVGLFNIGVEGQFMLGSIAALIGGIFFEFFPLLHVIVVLFFASLVSGILGVLIGYLKIKFNINEVITGIMFNWILFHINNLIIDLPVIKKGDSDLSKPIRESAFIDFFGSWKLSSEGLSYRGEHPFINDLLKAPLNFGIIIGIVVAILMWVLLNRTMLGFKISSIGCNILASYRVGIDIKKVLMFVMFLAGALSGLAGAIQVMGVNKGIFKLSYMEGTGFNGIAVALIGNNSPIGIIFSSVLFSILIYGSSRVQSLMGLSSSIVSLMIGIVVLVISASHFLRKIFLEAIKGVKRTNISN